MNQNPLENVNTFKIEMIKGPNNGEVSYCPKRGEIITSIKLAGKEIIYLDQETFKDLNVNVKGGVPILFPNAGPITENSEFPNLAQHGFARNMEWQSEHTENGFMGTLSANEKTRKMYPFDFKFSVSGRFEQDGSFTYDQVVENMEEVGELPLSMGLHPYFKVPNIEKSNIKFNFAGGKLVEEQIKSWVNGKTIKAISIDNPNVPMEIVIPGMGTLVMGVSPEFKKIWVWSVDGKDFICVEPVMRNANGLIDNPEKIKPKGKFSARVNLKLIE